MFKTNDENYGIESGGEGEKLNKKKIHAADADTATAKNKIKLKEIIK